MISLEDREPTTFGSMTEVVEAIRMGEGTIRHVRNNGRDFVRRFEGGSFRVFLIKWH